MLYRKSKKMTVHNAFVHCKLQRKKNAMIPTIVYLNNPFQDSTNA
jgi:hypothetical protein